MAMILEETVITTCSNCGATLPAKPGDCCAFCSIKNMDEQVRAIKAEFDGIAFELSHFADALKPLTALPEEV